LCLTIGLFLCSQAEILAAKKPVLVKPEDIPDVSQYDDLVSKFKGLKWRIISRPGGATMKPTDWYRLEGIEESN
jgi:hypothetical protein